MKKVLITGANSYIGTSFERYVKENNVDFEIDTLDLLDPKWENYDFSGYDSVFHLAAIVHKNEKNIPYSLYKEVNVDLAVKIAKKAKKQGVSQFVFLSSMSIFGVESGSISSITIINPITKYGKSKLEAEKQLLLLENDGFSVAIVRPPMVYGPNCTGNYAKLSNLIRKVPFFFKSNNKRSMIYIDHLSHHISLLISYQLNGIYHPQNKNYVSTLNMVERIAKVNAKRIVLIPFPTIIKNNLVKISVFNKLFADLYYSKDMSDIQLEYNDWDFEKTIEISEKN